MPQLTEMDRLILSAKRAAKNMDTFLDSMDMDLLTYGEDAPVEAAYAHVCKYVLKDVDLTPAIHDRLKDWLGGSTVRTYDIADFRVDKQYCVTLFDWEDLYRNYTRPEIRKEIRQAIRSKFGLRMEMAIVYGWDRVKAENADHLELLQLAIETNVDPNLFPKEWVVVALRAILLAGEDTRKLSYDAFMWAERHNFKQVDAFSNFMIASRR